MTATGVSSLDGQPPAITPVRIALVGMGRMGRTLDALGAERGHEIVARLDVAEMSRGISRADLNGAQVAIEFTQPDVAIPNASALLALGCPVVIGTTGWASSMPLLQEAVAQTKCAALWSPNFSLGVQLFLACVSDAAKRLHGIASFDAHIIETHHTAKLDAPSGTAIAVQLAAESGVGHAVPITSVRVGSVPGTHELIFDAPFEQIRMTHTARDRRVFADGALTAAAWLAIPRAAAIYTMQDVVLTTVTTPTRGAEQ